MKKKLAQSLGCQVCPEVVRVIAITAVRAHVRSLYDHVQNLGPWPRFSVHFYASAHWL